MPASACTGAKPGWLRGAAVHKLLSELQPSTCSLGFSNFPSACFVVLNIASWANVFFGFAKGICRKRCFLVQRAVTGARTLREFCRQSVDWLARLHFDCPLLRRQSLLCCATRRPKHHGSWDWSSRGHPCSSIRVSKPDNRISAQLQSKTKTQRASLNSLAGDAAVQKHQYYITNKDDFHQHRPQIAHHGYEP